MKTTKSRNTREGWYAGRVRRADIRAYPGLFERITTTRHSRARAKLYRLAP